MRKGLNKLFKLSIIFFLPRYSKIMLNKKKCSMAGLNRRPSRYKHAALPTELIQTRVPKDCFLKNGMNGNVVFVTPKIFVFKIALQCVCLLLLYPYPHRFRLVVGNYVENFVLIYFVRNADTAIGLKCHTPMGVSVISVSVIKV